MLLALVMVTLGGTATSAACFSTNRSATPRGASNRAARLCSRARTCQVWEVWGKSMWRKEEDVERGGGQVRGLTMQR
eukprot:360556-Chlamydomonas_euryale.AAC.2